MNILIFFTIFLGINLCNADLNVVNQGKNQNVQLPSNGVAVDEVVVESSLYIKPKQQRSQLRRVRKSIISDFNTQKSFAEHKRVKRQFGQFGQSQAASNAAAQQNFNNQFGFGNSAANAQAQAFNSQGTFGSFGASAAGTLTQAVNGNRFGVQNSAGASHTLTFNLPNGQSVNFASANNFANAQNGNNANSRGSAVSINRI